MSRQNHLPPDPMNDLDDITDVRDVTPGNTAAKASQFALAGFLVLGGLFAFVFWKKFSR